MARLFFGGDIIPMTGEGKTAEALLTTDEGKVAYVGSLEGARVLAKGAEETDLSGKTLMPGFIDPHSHFSGAIQYIITVDLSQCRTFDEIVDTMKGFMSARGIGKDGVVMGTGYDQNNLPGGRHPDRGALDRVSTEVPVIAIHASGHMGAANSKALDLAGLTAETPDPEGGRYGRDDATGELTGYAEEPSALSPINNVSLSRMNIDMSKMVGEMQMIYLQRGVTTCQDGATQENFAEMFAQLAKAGMLKLDLVSYPMYGQDIDRMLASHPEFDKKEYTGHYRIGGLKMFVDGSPQGRTAWMTEPYAPDADGKTDYYGFGTMTDEEALGFTLKALDGNHQLLCHCNGDAAADQYIRVYKEALCKTTNPDAAKLRPVMIHCQCTRKDQFDQMPAINMIPSIFVSHVWYWGDVHLKNFGPVRGGRVSAVHDALEAGLPYTFHTDMPVLLPNMLEAVWCAVNRKTKGGVQLDENQKIGVYDALKAITVNGAYQYGEEDSKGTLEVGKLADLVILDKNPLKVDPWDIRNIGIVETIKEGETVFSR